MESNLPNKPVKSPNGVIPIAFCHVRFLFRQAGWNGNRFNPFRTAGYSRNRNKTYSNESQDCLANGNKKEMNRVSNSLSIRNRLASSKGAPELESLVGLTP